MQPASLTISLFIVKNMVEFVDVQECAKVGWVNCLSVDQQAEECCMAGFVGVDVLSQEQIGSI